MSARHACSPLEALLVDSAFDADVYPDEPMRRHTMYRIGGPARFYVQVGSIGALKRFFFPDLFIFVFDITIKYIVMLGEFALQMLYALKLRSVGRNRSKYGSIGGVGGMLFIKSRNMSEEMYYAMECRGFTGEYHASGKVSFTAFDAAYILLNGGFVWLFVHFQNLV